MFKQFDIITRNIEIGLSASQLGGQTSQSGQVFSNVQVNSGVTILTPENFLDGCILLQTGLIANGSVTMPSGSDLDTYFSGVIDSFDVGFAVQFWISNADGSFGYDILMNTGVTRPTGGNASVIKGASKMFLLVKTGTATYLLFTE